MLVGKPLLGEKEIQAKVKELAEAISRDFAGEELVAIGILKGAFMFYSDLIRHIDVPVTVDFIIASSYLKTESTGEVRIHADIREDISGKNVLLVEDIVDTGITLNHIRERILQRAPARLAVTALLDKRERRIVDVPIEYKGFEIPDRYVVGYGLDFDGKFRNLPYISIFKRSE